MNLSLRGQANLRCVIYVIQAMLFAVLIDKYLQEVLPRAVWSALGIAGAGITAFRAFIDRSNHVANEAAAANGTQDGPPPPPNAAVSAVVVPLVDAPNNTTETPNTVANTSDDLNQWRNRERLAAQTNSPNASGATWFALTILRTLHARLTHRTTTPRKA